MLSKENKDLIQMQKGNIELSDFPEAVEDFSQKDHIQTGKNGGAKQEETPAMGSGFNRDAFGTQKDPPPMGSGFNSDTFGPKKEIPEMGSGFHHDIFEKD